LSEARRSAAEAFSVVFVCTGNRFRSPLAAALVERLTESLPVSATSYGTLELDGVPALPEAVAIAGELGIDLSGHRARPVIDAELGGVDVLLGFEDAHIRAAVVDAGAPRDRSFTLRHFMRLLREVEQPEADSLEERARGMVAHANVLRSTSPSTLADTMRDPLGAAANVQYEIAAEIRETALQLVVQLFGVRDRALPALAAPARGSRLRRRLRLR